MSGATCAEGFVFEHGTAAGGADGGGGGGAFVGDLFGVESGSSEGVGEEVSLGDFSDGEAPDGETGIRSEEF